MKMKSNSKNSKTLSENIRSEARSECVENKNICSRLSRFQTVFNRRVETTSHLCSPCIEKAYPSEVVLLKIVPSSRQSWIKRNKINAKNLLVKVKESSFERVKWTAENLCTKKIPSFCDFELDYHRSFSLQPKSKLITFNFRLDFCVIICDNFRRFWSKTSSNAQTCLRDSKPKKNNDKTIKPKEKLW